MGSEDQRVAVVACMDARLDAAGFLDDWPAPVHIVRNAGGRTTDDVLRSLAASCAMGTRRILVFHHTDCAMAAHSDDQIRDLLPPGADTGVDFLTIADPVEALREDVLSIRSSSLLPAGIEVAGFIYDLDSREAREIQV
jgi:carbonic anhydrase